jgi:DNA-binding IscR family transcriptional regulator
LISITSKSRYAVVALAELARSGMRGGYTLSRPAEEITVLEVVQTLDGKVGQEADEAGGIWGEGVTALRKVFGQTTIAEVARREAEESGSGMYFI